MSDRWFVLKRNATLHHLVPISKSIVVDLLNILGVGFKRHVCVFSKGQQMNWYYDVAGIDDVARMMLKKVSIKNFNENIKDQWVRQAKKLDKLLSKVETTKLSAISNNKLFSFYEGVVNNLELESALGTLSDFLSSELVVREAKKNLTRLHVVKKDFDDLVSVAMRTRYVSPYIKEQKDFLKIVCDKINGYNITNSLKLHSKKYWYLQNDYAFSTKLSADYFKELVENYIKEGHDPKKEYGKLNTSINKLSKEKNDLVSLAFLHRQKKFSDLMKLTDIHGLLWDLKKVEMQRAFYYLDLLLKEISNRFSLSFGDIKWYSPYEVRDLLKEGNKANKAEINNRKIFCVLSITPKKVSVITGLQAKSLATTIEKNFIGNRTKIYGQVGNKGCARGEVMVVINPRIKSKFKKGQVLVTGMTTPDFIPLMKNARAVITDEGGITCHAAIVSRELNLPCVVGTKNATKILKNGDIVEVDANNGIIKILK